MAKEWHEAFTTHKKVRPAVVNHVPFTNNTTPAQTFPKLLKLSSWVCPQAPYYSPFFPSSLHTLIIRNTLHFRSLVFLRRLPKLRILYLRTQGNPFAIKLGYPHLCRLSIQCHYTPAIALEGLVDFMKRHPKLELAAFKGFMPCYREFEEKCSPFTNLRRFDFCNSNIHSPFVEKICEFFPNLKFLNLADTQINSDSFVHINNLTCLEGLDVSGLRSSFPEPLSSTTIKTLHIARYSNRYWNPWSRLEVTLHKLQTSCRNLQSLTLDRHERMYIYI